MGEESDVLMKLRPVTFYYKPELDKTQTRQYGLVAEEVAEVAPQLVAFDKDGTPQAVRYHFVNAMLLNEVQKQRQLIEEQQKTNEEQNSTIARQQDEIQDLAARLGKLETVLAAKP
jgi:septal ring factor EnvC (AmiA/AmiB activator)